MNLVFHNLGPLKGRQVIDLTKRFYVFVGENNSGKTYTAQLLWAVLNRDYMYEFVAQYSETAKKEFLTVAIAPVLIQDYFDFLIKEKLPLVFNLNDRNAENAVLKDFKMSLECETDEVKLQVNIVENSDRQFGRSTHYQFLKKESQYTYTYSKWDLEDESEDVYKDFNTQVLKILLDLYLSNTAIYSQTFIPANRLFYASFYKYIMEYERENSDKIAKAIQKGVTNGELRKMAQRPYTEPINELIKKIYRLNTETNSRDEYNDLLEQLKIVMGGSIESTKVETIAMLDFMFKTHDTKHELPMYLASSSANQLTLFYLYLKYWANKTGNFLTMDEPEENLHPKNQLRLLDILLRFSQKNYNKVLITTHSPLMTDAVNTYLYLNKLHQEHDLDKQTLIEAHNLQNVSADIDLANEDLGVYFFNGTKMIDCGNDNYGVYFRDFRNITENIARNNRTTPAPSIVVTPAPSDVVTPAPRSASFAPSSML